MPLVLRRELSPNTVNTKSAPFTIWLRTAQSFYGHIADLPGSAGAPSMVFKPLNIAGMIFSDALDADARCHPTNTGTDSMLLLPWQRDCKCSTDGLLFTNVLVNSKFQMKHSDGQIQSTIRFILQVNHLQWFRSTPDDKIWTVALNCNLPKNLIFENRQIGTNVFLS